MDNEVIVGNLDHRVFSAALAWLQETLRNQGGRGNREMMMLAAREAGISEHCLLAAARYVGVCTGIEFRQDCGGSIPIWYLPEEEQ